DALSRSPRKRPTWTNTSVTAKATPDTVIRNRSLSWSRLLVARSTTSHLLARQTADHSLDDQVGGFLRRAHVDPIVVALGDRERDRAVGPGPDRLRHEIRVGQLGAEAARGDAVLDRQLQKRVGVFFRIAARRLLVLFGVGDGRPRRHEHQ